MKHRNGWEFKDEETQRKFFELTKKNNTYFSAPEKKRNRRIDNTEMKLIKDI